MDGKQLKNSILQWAIQGKLVPQNPKDEPAQKLLERIAASRNGDVSPWSEAIGSSKNSKKSLSTSLRGAKATKQSKNPPSRIYRENGVWYEQVGTAAPKDISDEIPFEIPENWAWTNINSIARIVTDGEHLTPQRVDSFQGFYLLSARNILDGKISLDSVDYVDQSEYNRIANRCNPSRNDILISCSGSVGRVAVVNDDNCYVMVRSAAMIRVVELDSYYLMYALQSPCLQEQIQSKSKQTAQANLFQAAIRSLFIPIPPLAEQKRIVAKLDQALPLAEEYGAAQEQLDKLNKELPEALKKSILQEAIQGKLVPQNPKDEPAQKLLERIAASRNESSLSLPKGTSSTLLRGAKATKQSKNPPSRIYRENGVWYEQVGTATPKDISDEIPFEIPETWAWCRVERLFDVWSARRVHEKDWRKKGVPFYRAREIGKLADFGTVDNELFIDQSLYEEFSETGIPKKNDMMITAVGTLGKVYVIKDDKPFYFKDGSVLCMSNKANVDPLFYKHCIESPFFRDQYEPESGGTTVATLTMVRFNKYLVPLPPLAEQKRIVAKLEQLFKVL